MSIHEKTFRRSGSTYGILQCRDERAPRLKANLGLRLAWRRPHIRLTIDAIFEIRVL